MSSKLLAFVACLAIAGVAAAETGQLEVKDAWARATPGKAENSVLYFTILSPVADRLVSVSTPVAKTAELHTMTTEGGVMKMRPLAEVDVPAGQPVTLKPGGMHVMLMGLKQPLHAGETFPVTLSFATAGSREVTVAVEKPGATGPGGHAGSGMDMPMPGHR